jgi:hypothetical protein
MLAPIDMVVASANTVATGAVSDAIPFTLQENAQTLASLGELLPKLQGFASIASRYQVLQASLHYQSLSAASERGSVGGALVPGALGAASSIPELASYDHSFIGPVWAGGLGVDGANGMSTSVWKNREMRFYHTQASTTQELVPFTILRRAEVAEANIQNSSAVGIYWLELVVEFCDLRPMPQSQATFIAGNRFGPLTGGATFTNNVVSWVKNAAMRGLWQWGKNRLGTALLGGAPYLLGPATTVATDAAQTIEWYGDIKVEEVAAPEKKSPVILSWTEQDEKQDVCVTVPRTFPGPWRAQPRIREVCAFRSVADAQEAQRSGFDPARVLASEPNAAGDFTVDLLFQPDVPYRNFTTLATYQISGGTGAQEVKLQHSFAVGDNPGSVFIRLTPTGTETRYLSADSSFDLTAVNQITSTSP